MRVGTVLQQHLSVHYAAVILAFFESQENAEPQMVAKIGSQIHLWKVFFLFWTILGAFSFKFSMKRIKGRTNCFNCKKVSPNYISWVKPKFCIKMKTV
jgi:hypothetical protein